MRFNFFKNLLAKFRGNDDKRIITEVLSDSRAVFSSFGNDIYFSDFVNNCIDRIASEVSKIEIVSVVEKENSVRRVNDCITRLFKFQPNPLQTTKDFLSSCEWLRRKHMNAFIYPQYDAESNQYTAFYPLDPVSVELGYFEDGGRAIKFFWRDGSANSLPYESVIHLKWRRGISMQIGGGNDVGAVDDSNTLRSLKTLDELLQGLPKMIASSLNLNGVLSVKTLVEKTALEQAAKDFESRIYKSKSGIVAVGLEGNYTPVNKAFPAVPDNVMKFLKDIIRERYGVSEAILSGDFDGKAHAAFYQNCIEPFIVEFEQAFTERLFTRQAKDKGHRIKCYYSKIAYMDATEKRELAELGRDTGLMSLNEMRELYGMSPIEDGDRRLQSLNYVNLQNADNYQVGRSKSILRSDYHMKQSELRSYGVKEFRAMEVDNEKIIEGHAAVFGQKVDIDGWFYEVIERGAFDGCDFSDVALFINHDNRGIPLARTQAGTLELSIDNIGLAIRAKLDVENNPDARALYSSVARGDISGMSFGFAIRDVEWQDINADMSTRVIKKIEKVFDVSAATYPYYEGTDISARAKMTLESAKKERKDLDERNNEHIQSPKYMPGKGFIPMSEGRDRGLDSALEQREKAGKELKENPKNLSVKSPLSVFGELRAVTVTPPTGQPATIVVPSTYSQSINPDFRVVSSLVDAVAHLNLNGGESFQQAYITGIDAGNYTAEGANAAAAETRFAYAAINKTKITAYAELTEELQKLPSAPYADVVFQNVRTSIREVLAKEILVGAGGANQIIGIFSSLATAIDASTDLAISQITDTTLDEILFRYGGDEEVETPAVLILNKNDLLAFSKVRTSTKQKFYDIQLNGNGGTISGVPFIINKACKSLMASDTAANDYCMAYGNLSNYQLVEFSPMEVKSSGDYKFREGMTAYRGVCFFGGNVVKHNGFLRVKKASS